MQEIKKEIPKPLHPLLLPKKRRRPKRSWRRIGSDS